MDASSRVLFLKPKDAIVPRSRYLPGEGRLDCEALRVAAETATAGVDAGNPGACAGLQMLSRIPAIARRLIRRARRSHRALALVCLNLDDFRLVCEAYGRAESDKASNSATSILRAEFDAHAVFARAGRGKYIVVLTGLVGAADAVKPVQRVLDAIAKPRMVGGQELRTTASAGIAFFPDGGGDYETLLRNSNAAMHKSKSLGPGGLQFHSGNVALHAKQRLRLRTDLRRAVSNAELTLHYQPQFEVHSGRPCGVEVLARWFPLNGDAIEPRVFIPLAEQSGLIGALGAWVLQEACKTVAGWRIPGVRPPTLCVNVSTQQIDGNMCAVIRRAIEGSGLPAHQLELEITESSLIKHPEAVLECLGQWKELGVRIAIDDFGTGYSSLSYLSRLPVDRLKLDRSLIHNLTTKRKDAAIVRSVIALGKELGLSVIAEGVETEDQFQMLEELGCLQVQGYLLARPGPPQDAHHVLRRRWGMRHFSSQPARVAGAWLNAS